MKNGCEKQFTYRSNGKPIDAPASRARSHSAPSTTRTPPNVSPHPIGYLRGRADETRDSIGYRTISGNQDTCEAPWRLSESPPWGCLGGREGEGWRRYRC